MNALEWIKVNGYTGACVVLDKLPKNTTHMTDDGRHFINAKNPNLCHSIRKELNDLVVVSDLKNFKQSIDIIKSLCGLEMAMREVYYAISFKRRLIGYFKNGEEMFVHFTRVKTAIEDYILIYGDSYE